MVFVGQILSLQLGQYVRRHACVRGKRQYRRSKREKRGHIVIDVIFQKTTVPELLLEHITKLGRVPASCVAPVLGAMNCSQRSPTSPAPRCSTPLPSHGDMRDPLSVGKFGLLEVGVHGLTCLQPMVLHLLVAASCYW